MTGNYLHYYYNKNNQAVVSSLPNFLMYFEICRKPNQTGQG